MNSLDKNILHKNSSHREEIASVVNIAENDLIEQLNSFVNKVSEDSELLECRNQSLTKFKSLGYPNARQEQWKYTDLQHLLTKNLKLTNNLEKNKLSDDQRSRVSELLANYQDANLLVLVDGHYYNDLSRMSSELNSELNKNSDDYIGSISGISSLEQTTSQLFSLKKIFESGYEHSIANLVNTAYTDGIVIKLSNKYSEHMSHIRILNIFTNSISKKISNTKNICILDSSIELDLIEEYISLEENEDVESNSNTVFDFVLSPNSVCRHYVLQNLSDNQYHIAYYNVNQQQDSSYKNYNINFGAKLSRQDIVTNQVGSNSSSELYGLFLPQGTQHMDSHLKVFHNNAHGKSIQDYRGVLSDRGHGVFNGMVYVAEGTVDNNAAQSSKNILLSKHAQVDAKPELQIYADDVVCSHGATIGKLDEDAIFYLQSRGIDKESAKKLLILAFINHIANKIDNELVKDWLSNILKNRYNVE